MNREEKMIVALAGCSHALSHGYLLIFPTVLLLLKEEFSLGYLGLGVIGNIMTFSYGLGALPAGMIYDRIGAKRLYLVCFLGSACASLLVAFSPNLLLFTAGLALLGGLGSVYHPMVNALITSKVKQYGIALGIHGAAGNIGLALTPILAGLIASRWGWRAAYLAFCGPGIALSIWSLFVDLSVKKEEEKDPSVVGPRFEPASQSRNFWIYLSAPLLLLYTLNCLQSFSFYGATTFLPTYIAKHTSFRIFSWDSVAVGGMLSGLVLFMGVFGQYTGGVLGQRLRPERSLVLMTGACFPFILGMSFTRDTPLLLMALCYFFFNFGLQPMLNVLLARNTRVAMRGTAFGIYFFVSASIGSLSSSFSGYIAERFGLQWVFLGLSGAILAALFFAFLLFRVARRQSPAPD